MAFTAIVITVESKPPNEKSKELGITIFGVPDQCDILYVSNYPSKSIECTMETPACVLRKDAVAFLQLL